MHHQRLVFGAIVPGDQPGLLRGIANAGHAAMHYGHPLVGVGCKAIFKIQGKLLGVFHVGKWQIADGESLIVDDG